MRINRQAALFLAVIFLYWSSLYFYIPTLPVYVRLKTGTLAQVGTVLAMNGLWQGLVRLPLGIAADWLGRRKVLIIAGVALSGVGAWMLAVAQGFGMLAAGRAVTGLASSVWVLLTVAFSSLYPPAEAIRASAVLIMASSLSRMTASALNGSLVNWGGYPLAFFVAMAAAGLGAGLCVFTKETPRPGSRPSWRRVFGLIFRRDVLLPSLAAAVLQYAVFGVSLGFIPILAGNLGAGSQMQSLLTSLNIGAITITSLGVARLVGRVRPLHMVMAAFVVMAAGLLLGALAKSLPMVILSQAVTGLASGLGYPVLMGLSITHVDEGERSTAMGVYQSIYALGMFGGPWLCGLLADWLGLQPMIGVTAGMVLGLGWLLVRVQSRTALPEAG